MTIPIPPPGAVFIIGVGIFAVVAASAVRREGSIRIRLITVAVAAVLIGGLLLFIYRPQSITIDAAGISSNSGGELSIPWSTVTESRYVSDLQNTKYRTTTKIGGVSFGPYRVGTFKTAGAGRARVVAQQQKSAVIVEAGGSLYEFGPEKIHTMTSEIARHISVSGWPAKD